MHVAELSVKSYCQEAVKMITVMSLILILIKVIIVILALV